MGDKSVEMTLAEIDAELARRGNPPASDLAAVDAELARRSKGRPSFANAGLAQFATNVLGLPVDLVTNAVNLGIAGAGAITSGLPGRPPELIQNPVGGSQWLQERLRATGQPGLSPDNPNPQDRVGSVAYEQTARGGFIPGGAIPAAASIVAEKTLGPEWAGPAAMAPAAIAQGGRSAAAAITRPNTPEAQMLAAEGVQLTPGQARGGIVKSFEDKATSIPVLGETIKGAQRRGMEQYTRAALNRALRPVGERLPDNLTGREAVDYVRSRLGDKYEELLPNLRGDLNARAPAPSGQPSAGTYVAPFNPVTGQQPAAPQLSLRDELDQIRQIGQNLPEPQRGQIGRIIDKEILERFTPQGLASGETLKDIESKLGGLKTTFRRSENYDVRNLGDAVDAMQGALRRMVNRVNPEYQGELAKINDGYANFKVTQKAAGSLGAQDGVFSPAQLHSAVKAHDKSKDKARFAEGGARMQDLSEAGKAVLPSTVPDSGTPGRAILAYAAAHPIKAAGLAPFIGAASLPYTSLGARALSRLGEPGTANLKQIIAQSILAEQQANGGFPTLEQELGRK